MQLGMSVKQCRGCSWPCAQVGRQGQPAPPARGCCLLHLGVFTQAAPLHVARVYKL